MLTQFVTTTINHHINENTTDNMVDQASIKDKNVNEVNDETEGSRLLIMQSFDDSLRQMIVDKITDSKNHVSESNMVFNLNA